MISLQGAGVAEEKWRIRDGCEYSVGRGNVVALAEDVHERRDEDINIR